MTHKDLFDAYHEYCKTVTLKISDLSVGDWVKVKDDTYKVMGITMFAELDLCNSSVAYRETLDNIEPVPITAEILEKNGFEKTAIGDIYRHESDIEVTLYGDGWWHTVSLDEYSLHKINGVHQLQHLLRLYGEYREVNL
ncbi:MAG: hypothetical protein IKU16_09605 [Muribaculaceae bacterium]|nr:hypothetical protein [Muribaculaceae bacterium]MBR4887507.1 hypothetical protein [Muribaculaceae bacterium]